jgi:hypothetical protein
VKKRVFAFGPRDNDDIVPRLKHVLIESVDLFIPAANPVPADSFSQLCTDSQPESVTGAFIFTAINNGVWRSGAFALGVEPSEFIVVF